MIRTLALLAIVIFAACSGATGLAGKLQGRWVDSDGFTMEFSGTTLREHGQMGASALELTSPITYKEPDQYAKPGLGGTVYYWRVIFEEPNHIEIVPPFAGLQPIQHFSRQ